MDVSGMPKIEAGLDGRECDHCGVAVRMAMSSSA